MADAQDRGDIDATTSPRVASGIPAWSGSETLYSWCVGYHKVYGGASAKSTGMTLFGRPNACRLHDLPSGLAFLERQTGGALGSMEEILLTRTVLAAYAPLMDDEKYMRLAESLIAGNASGSKAAWGITASRLGAVHPLRFCPICATSDEACHGRRLWRLEHQLPATHVCIEHAVELHAYCPNEALWLEPPPVESLPKFVDRDGPAMRVAMVVRGISSCRRLQWDSVAEAIVSLAAKNGYDVGTANRFRSSGFQRMLAASHVWGWFLSAADSSGQMHRPDWAVETLRDRRMRHPSRVAVLWAAAHESTLSPQRSLDHFTSAASSSSSLIQAPLWPALEATRWNDHPSKLVAAIETGNDMVAVAAEVGVAVGTLRRWLRDCADLGAQWRTARFERRLRNAVAAFERHLQTSRVVTRSSLLRVLNTECEWLRRNAPSELRSLLDSVPTKRHPQMSFDF